jgi:flagellar biosynthesis protein FliQ
LARWSEASTEGESVTPEQIVTLARMTLELSVWLCAPILAVAIVVGFMTSILQVMTSIQEMTIGTVPRLAAVGLVTYLMMPWLIQKLVSFANLLFSNFRPYIG